MWDKIAAVSAAISVIISVAALLVANSGAEKSASIASEALAIARQSNDIALGRMRESPVVEIYSYEDPMDFTNSDTLNEDLEIIVSIKNSGDVALDGLAMEVIGIEPLTYPENNPNDAIRPLPSKMVDVGLETMIQPSGTAHIDMRIPVLMYLAELDKAIDDKSSTYITTINVVLIPKAIGDSLPSGVHSSDTREDRRLITVHFDPAILSTEIVIDLLENEFIVHRVYSP